MKKMLAFLALSTLCCDAIAEEPTTKQEQISTIDFQIQQMRAELHNYRLKASNAEMEAQPMMFDDWSHYAQEVKESEADEQKVRDIKKKLRELYDKKQALINNPNP